MGGFYSNIPLKVLIHALKSLVSAAKRISVDLTVPHPGYTACTDAGVKRGQYSHVPTVCLSIQSYAVANTAAFLFETTCDVKN